MAITASGVHEICDEYVDELVALDPVAASYMGVDGYDDQLTDYSASGYRARADLTRAALRAMESATPTDESERIAKEVFRERAGISLELHDAELDVSQLNKVDSPAQNLRQVFDLMSTGSAQQWRILARRLAAVPDSIASLRSGLASAAESGNVAAVRQVSKVAEQCDAWAGRTAVRSFFATLVAGARGIDEALRRELEEGATVAERAYAGLADFLRTDLLPHAPEKDAVGRQRYELWSRYFTGARFDLTEAYEWGWAEFARLEGEAKRIVERIVPGGTLTDAAASLDADKRYEIHGQGEFVNWMQKLSDDAVRELGETHFHIPDRIARLECLIAPPGGAAGAYYTAPSEDFSRPGRMWWSVGAGRARFSTWREASVVYHEGVPGHHLQIATAVDQAQRLNRFQRLACELSGYCEGWALYAERLMDELGYLAEDGVKLGMLNEQLLRAARVIVDIGMHLELEIPRGTGFHEGQRWTPDLGLEFMLTRTVTDSELVRDEIDRYLGWPGQAPSYKLGERLWLELRESARARAGANFDLKDFHRTALEMGPMGLDTLRAELGRLTAHSGEVSSSSQDR